MVTYPMPKFCVVQKLMLLRIPAFCVGELAQVLILLMVQCLLKYTFKGNRWYVKRFSQCHTCRRFELSSWLTALTWPSTRCYSIWGMNQCEKSSFVSHLHINLSLSPYICFLYKIQILLLYILLILMQILVKMICKQK